MYRYTAFMIAHLGLILQPATPAHAQPSDESHAGCACDAHSRTPAGTAERALQEALEPYRVACRLARAESEAAELRLQLLDARLRLQQAELLLASKGTSASRSKSLELFPEAYVLRAAVWTTTTIPVSWENPTPGNALERAWVRDAIARTWGKESGLSFTGWGPADENSQGIRIRIADAHPHCKGLGNRLDGMRDGMVLNTTFENWCPACRLDRQGSIEKIAIHEFGHAIGFAHEQNRPDAPDWCQDERQGSDGDWRITIYDPESIMNYCNSEWNNGGRLSALDIQAVQLLYGAPDADDESPGKSESAQIEPVLSDAISN